MSRHSNLKHLMDTYNPLCVPLCSACELYIGGNLPNHNCFYEVCSNSVNEHGGRKISTTEINVTPKEFLNIFEEMLSACSNNAGAACDGVSCEECAFHKLITLIGIGCNNVSVAKWVKKNLVNWHED